MTVENATLRYILEQDLMYFIRFIFKAKSGIKFTVNSHHKEIITNLELSEKSEITKLIINTPPRYSKTEILKMYIARGILKNPRAKYLYLSYSDQLALDCSEGIKDIINLPICQTLWNVKIKKGSNSKQKWYTEQGGGIYATSTKGQVTGFGAGVFTENIDETFNGAIIIDDPIKPEDAIESVRFRELINERFNNTIRSRVNSKTTPIIIIMQRLHENDLTGFLENGGSGETWTKIVQKAIKDDGTPLWESKHNLAELEQIRIANPSVFFSQYMQSPTPPEGLAFNQIELKYFKRADLLDKKPDFIISFADVADGGGDNYSMPIGYLFFVENTIICYIVDAIYTKKDGRYYEPLTIEKLNQHLIAEHYVEKNNQGAGHIRYMLDNKHNSTKIYPIQARGKKEVRIEIQTRFIIDNFRYLHQSEYALGSEYYYFFNDLVNYRKDGKNKNDDAPDSLAGLSYVIRQRFRDRRIA